MEYKKSVASSRTTDGAANADSSDQQVRDKRSSHSRRKRAKTNKHEIRRCSMNTFEKCLGMMQEVMQNSSLAFPTNVDDLEITCKWVKEKNLSFFNMITLRYAFGKSTTKSEVMLPGEFAREEQ